MEDPTDESFYFKISSLISLVNQSAIVRIHEPIEYSSCTAEGIVVGVSGCDAISLLKNFPPTKMARAALVAPRLSSSFDDNDISDGIDEWLSPSLPVAIIRSGSLVIKHGAC